MHIYSFDENNIPIQNKVDDIDPNLVNNYFNKPEVGFIIRSWGNEKFAAFYPNLENNFFRESETQETI